MARAKYLTHVKPNLKNITKWIREGETQYAIADKLGISERSWHEYKNKYCEFDKAITLGQQQLISVIEQSMYKRCMWTEVEDIRTLIEQHNGKEKKKIEKIKRKVAPSDSLIVFVLKNLAPEKWKDKQDEGLSGLKPVVIVDNIAEYLENKKNETS